MSITQASQTQESMEGFGLVPKSCYLSREFAELEAQRLWPYVWQMACREEDIPRVGDYIEYEIADRSVLIVRVAGDQIKAYFNACLHRGTQLKEGCGNAKEIRCRYHAWRWNLDGTIKEVTDAKDFDPCSIAADCLKLPECQVESWAGFVFINMDPAAEPLATFLGVVPDRLERFRLERMRCTRQRSTILECNWKTAYDAFAEGYHTVGIHPQLLMWMDDTFRYQTFGDHGMLLSASPTAIGTPSPRIGYAPPRAEVLHSMVSDMESVGMLSEEDLALAEQMLDMVSELPDEEPLTPLFATLRRMQAESRGFDCTDFSDNDHLFGELWTLFPNLNVPVSVMNGTVMRFRPNGMDPESCFFDIWNLERLPEGEQRHEQPEREFFADWRDHDAWGSILIQDLENLPGVQKGMHSLQSEYLILGRQELIIQNYHRALARYLGR